MFHYSQLMVTPRPADLLASLTMKTPLLGMMDSEDDFLTN